MPDDEQKRPTIAVLGLGSMGLGMARSVQASNLDVIGYDPYAPSREAFASTGGVVSEILSTAVRGREIVISVVVNAAQTEHILFGDSGVATQLAEGSVFVGCSTMPPATVIEFASRLEARGVHYLDAPMSGGPTKAADGALTFMASGSAAAFEGAQPALVAMAEKIYRLGDAPGQGTSMKMINQLLAGVHIATACEAISLAVRMGLEPGDVYDVITNAAGNSWMFENRVPHILDGDYSPKSAVNIFTKDLGIVTDTGRANDFPLPMASQALQMFTMAASAGMGGDDDASLARVYAALSGIELPPSNGA